MINETTAEDAGEGAFKSEWVPDVCAIVVNKNSWRWFREIAGGGFEDQVVRTGLEETGFVMVEIQFKQGCMIYRRSRTGL